MEKERETQEKRHSRDKCPHHALEDCVTAPPALLQALAQLAVRVMQRARISSTPTCKEKRKKEKRKKKAWAEEVEHLVRDWDSIK